MSKIRILKDVMILKKRKLLVLVSLKVTVLKI